MPQYVEYDSYDPTARGQPAFSYPLFSGLTLPGSPTSLVIPLLITSFTSPNAKGTINQIVGLPNYNGTFTYGGTAAGAAVTTLPEISLEATIDTPTISSTDASSHPVQLPAPTVTDGINTTHLSYGELMVMYFEGRTGSDWNKIHPTWFRDPYGRYFNTPKFTSLTVGFVEGTPGRTSLQVTMKVA